MVLVLFAIFILPIYLRSKMFTLPEYLERRFDARSRFYFSGLTLVGNIVIEAAAVLYAGALVVQLVFPDVPVWQIVTVLALIAGVYTISGGLSAVIYTDAIQAMLLVFDHTQILYSKLESSSPGVSSKFCQTSTSPCRSSMTLKAVSGLSFRHGRFPDGGDVSLTPHGILLGAPLAHARFPWRAGCRRCTGATRA